MRPGDFGHVVAVGSEAEIAALPADTEAVLVRRLTDAKARALGQLESLRVLLHDGSPELTDLGVEFLSRLESLESLDLEWAAITDAGFRHLEGLARLRWLDLTGCSGFSAVALRRLRHALPDCQIEP